MSTSPAFRVSEPERPPDVLDHLSRSERLLTARELALILAISPKTLYSYAERNMIPHFKIEANVRFRGRDIAEWFSTGHPRLITAASPQRHWIPMLADQRRYAVAKKRMVVGGKESESAWNRCSRLCLLLAKELKSAAAGCRI